MDYFFKTINFYNLPRDKFDQVATTCLHTITGPDRRNRNYELNNLNDFIYLRDFMFPKLNMSLFEHFRLVNQFQGYLLFKAKKSVICIQRAARLYLKKLKWHRIGLAIMAELAPILYHPKSPYMQRLIASW